MKNLRKILIGGLSAVVLGTLVGNLLPVGGCKAEEDKDPKIIIAEYIANHEGRRNKVYDPIPNDGKHEPTIGVGHYLDRGDSRETFARVLPEVDFDSIYNGERKLSKKQIDRLFAADLESYISKARIKVPKLDEYPVYLQSAIVDGFYRGCLAGSSNTLKHINQGNFNEAAKEYLRNEEYKNAKKIGRSGIRPRMERNQERMFRYYKESQLNSK